MGVWVGGDRLRPTHLRATLTRLTEKERREWQPCVLQLQDPRQPHQQEEVGVSGRDGAVWWQGEACGALGWGYETKFGAAAILDQMLLRVRIPARYLHAVAAAAVFLSAKVNEEDENVPSTEEVVWRGQMKCSARELLRMERVLLDKLSWCLPPTTVLDFLQVLHALAIVTAPKHHYHHHHHQRQCHGQRYQCCHALRGEDSPTHQLEALTVRLWHVVGCGESGALRPSLLALALLSLELEAATPEPGLTPWLQALTQVSEEELVEAQGRVRTFLGEVVDSYRSSALSPPPSLVLPAAPTPETVPPSRPNKRKVDVSTVSEEEAYVDIKKLYAHGKTHTTTTTSTASPQQKAPQIEADDLYADIRRLYSSPPPFHPSDTPSPTPQLLPGASVRSPAAGSKRGTSAKRRRRRKKATPSFKAKTAVRSCLKQALKIPCKISLIATKKIFEEPIDGEEEEEMMEEEDEEMDSLGEEVEEEEDEPEGPIVEPVGILNSPIFSPMSPEFPDIKHLVVKKEDMCWDQQVRAVAEQVYRPLTYAQVLRLHLTPLTRALGV